MIQQYPHTFFVKKSKPQEYNPRTGEWSESYSCWKLVGVCRYEPATRRYLNKTDSTEGQEAGTVYAPKNTVLPEIGTPIQIHHGGGQITTREVLEAYAQQLNVIIRV